MSVLGNAKSSRQRKTYLVEPGGTGREYMFLLGETWRVRASRESAEAIVVWAPGESRVERRAEEAREDHSLHPSTAARRRATRVRSGNCGSFRAGGPSQAGGFLRRYGACPSSRGGQRVQASEEVQWATRSRLVWSRCWAPRIHSAVDARGLSPPGSTAGCGKPHVRWCGRDDGRNPVISTRS